MIIGIVIDLHLANDHVTQSLVETQSSCVPNSNIEGEFEGAQAMRFLLYCVEQRGTNPTSAEMWMRMEAEYRLHLAEKKAKGLAQISERARKAS